MFYNYLSETFSILVLVETSLQLKSIEQINFNLLVTILVLVETSLQFKNRKNLQEVDISHNPYFSGNFFAMGLSFIEEDTGLFSQSLF